MKLEKRCGNLFSCRNNKVVAKQILSYGEYVYVGTPEHPFSVSTSLPVSDRAMSKLGISSMNSRLESFYLQEEEK